MDEETYSVSARHIDSGDLLELRVQGNWSLGQALKKALNASADFTDVKLRVHSVREVG